MLRLLRLPGERGGRAYDGLSDKLLFLKPNPLVWTLLDAKVRSGDVVPHANTFQDAVETVFSPHAAAVSLGPFTALPDVAVRGGYRKPHLARKF